MELCCVACSRLFQIGYLIGRAGYVNRVYAYADGDPLVMREDCAKVSMLNVAACFCQDVAEETPVVLVPALLHWRRVQKAQRDALAEYLQANLHPEHIELVKSDTMFEHMTVKVESHFGQKVDVHVHRCKRQGDWYSREITLVTQQSQRIVQYGIVRLDTTKLDAKVWQKIESQSVPLGRVLIEHDVLREVQMCELWKVTAGPSLAGMMHLQVHDELYGRTALIYCDGAPAIELLEIVVPD